MTESTGITQLEENVPTALDGQTRKRRLYDLDFTDLFFSERGEAFLRGLETDANADSAAPLAAVPADVLDDVDEIHRRTCDKGQISNEFFIEYDDMRFRVAKIEEVDGIWYTLRRAKWPVPRLSQLVGIPPRVIEYLGYLGQSKSGLIIVAGATGHGKTTTACSLLQEYLLAFGDVAVTIEDPIELPLSGPHGRGAHGHCFQTQVENGDFATAMKRSMRHSPRYILLGEVRSAGEASQAIRAAINGHLVITTIHAGSVPEAIDAMTKFVAGIEPIELARSVLGTGLAGVIHQKLTRVKGRGKVLKLEYLFPGEDQGIRSIIRSGKTEQLSTAVQAQAARVLAGKKIFD